MKLSKLVHIIVTPIIGLTAIGSAIALSSCSSTKNEPSKPEPKKPPNDKPTSLKIVKPSNIPTKIYVDKRINIDGFLYKTLPEWADKTIWAEVDNTDVAYFSSFYTLSIKPNKVGPLNLTLKTWNKKYPDISDQITLSFNVIENPSPEPKKPEHIVKQFPAECIGGSSGSFSLDYWEDKLNECTIVDSSYFKATNLNFNNNAEFTHEGKKYKITKIADDAFNNHIKKNVTLWGSLTIPKEIKEIGKRVFNRTSLEEVKFLTDDMGNLPIGENTFYNCPFIETIDVSKSTKGTCGDLHSMFQFIRISKIKVPSVNFNEWKYSNYGVSHLMVAVDE